MAETSVLRRPVIRIGTSGWAYPEWRGPFYPAGLPQRRRLEYLADRLPSVEINGSFYSLQRPASYRSWSAQTPESFCFAVKGGRFVTHLKRLRDPETPLANFFASGVLALGRKLGPVLWQLPADLPFDVELLTDFLAMLPGSTVRAAELANRHSAVLAAGRTWLTVAEDRPVRHAIEVRHDSFGADVFLDLLRANDIALVVSDSPQTWPRFEEVTASFGYVRLHGDNELYASGYREGALREWASKIRDRSRHGDVHVYFDNTAKGHAPRDACRLHRILAEDPNEDPSGVAGIARPALGRRSPRYPNWKEAHHGSAGTGTDDG